MRTKKKKKVVKPKPEFSISLWCWSWSDLEETESTGALYWCEWFPTKQSAEADLEEFRERLAKYDKEGLITTYGPEKYVVKSKEEMLELVNYPPAKASGLVNHQSNLHSVYYKPIDTWLVPAQLAVREAFVLLFSTRLTVFKVRYGFNFQGKVPTPTNLT